MKNDLKKFSMQYLTQFITKVLLIIGAIIFCIIFSDKIFSVLAPVLGAVILAYIISPIVTYMTNRKVPKGVSIILIYILIILLIVFGCIFFVPKLGETIKQAITAIPKWTTYYQTMIIDFVEGIQVDSWSADFKTQIIQIIYDLFSQIQTFITNMLSQLVKGTLASISFIIDVFLVFFMGYYIIMDGDKFKKGFLWLISPKWRNDVEEVVDEANSIIYKYLKGQALVSLILSAIYSVIYIILGIKHAVLLGIFGGITNAIPYVGPYIGAIPAVIVGFTTSVQKGIVVIIAVIIMQQIDNNLISPQVVKANLGISPAISIMSIILFGEFFGFVGVLLGVPFAAITIFIIRKIIEFQRRDLPESERNFERYMEKQK